MLALFSSQKMYRAILHVMEYHDFVVNKNFILELNSSFKSYINFHFNFCFSLNYTFKFLVFAFRKPPLKRGIGSSHKRYSAMCGCYFNATRSKNPFFKTCKKSSMVQTVDGSELKSMKWNIFARFCCLTEIETCKTVRRHQKNPEIIAETCKLFNFSFA